MKNLNPLCKLTPYNQILIFEEQLCTVCPIWIFIFDTDQAQINGVDSLNLR